MFWSLDEPIADPIHGALDAVMVTAVIHDFKRKALVICYEEGVTGGPEGFECKNVKELRYEDVPAVVDGISGDEITPAITVYTDFLATGKLDLSAPEPDGVATAYTVLKDEGKIDKGAIDG